MSFSVKQYPQLNFAHLITQYTREFRTGNVEAAVDYFALICLNADIPGSLGKSQASVCHEALREFILETRDFAKLLGDIRADGSRIKGIIEQRLELINLTDQADFLKNITVQAAGVADDKGLITDAVLLYHLAEDYDRVIEIVNRALSDAIAVELGGTMPKLQPLVPRVDQSNNTNQAASAMAGSSLSLTAVDDPMVLGKNMVALYNSNPMYYEKIRQTNRDACGLLLRMLMAKAEVESGRWAEALDVSLGSILVVVFLPDVQLLTSRRPSTNLVSCPCKLAALYPSSEVPPTHSRLPQRSSRATSAMSSCGALHALVTNATGELPASTRPTRSRSLRMTC